MNRRFRIGLLPLMLALSACATNADTTTTLGAVTTTVPTTTTTTEPPGLGAQQLQFAFGAERLNKYDTTMVIDIDIDASGTDMEDVDSKNTVSLEGRLWHLILSGPSEGTFEVIEDFRADSGFIDGSLGTLEFSQDLTDVELEEFSGIVDGFVIDTAGALTAGLGGTPGSFGTDPAASGPISSFGVPFPVGPVGVGDSWTAELDVPDLGTLEVEATITGEEEFASAGLAYRIDFTGMVSDLPIELTLEEALATLSGDATATGALLSLSGEGVELSLVISSVTIEGTYAFDPAAGSILEIESQLGLAIDMSMSDADREATIHIDEALTTTSILSETAPVQSFERSGIFARLQPDPFDLAYDALLQPPDYTWVEVTEEDLESFGAKVEVTSADLFAGIGYGALLGPEGDRLLTFSLTTASWARGDPTFDEVVAEYWGGGNPTEVDVGDQIAFRVRVDGVDWLVWGNETTLFVIVGDRTAAAEVMAYLTTGQTPYQWQTGDCLDFRDGYDDSTPYAPFGELGLRHCLSEHTHEVIYAEVLPEGPDAEYPDDMGDRSLLTCEREFANYTGIANLFETELEQISYLPDRNEWAEGARYLACVVYHGGADGPNVLEGRLTGMGPDFPVSLEVGACMPLMGSAPVPCDEPHQKELIAIAEYPAASGDPFPSVDDLFETAAEICDDALDDYDPTDGPFDVFAFPMLSLSVNWDSGERSFFCAAGTYDSEGFPVDIIGDLKGGWEAAPEQDSV